MKQLVIIYGKLVEDVEVEFEVEDAYLNICNASHLKLMFKCTLESIEACMWTGGK